MRPVGQEGRREPPSPALSRSFSAMGVALKGCNRHIRSTKHGGCPYRPVRPPGWLEDGFELDRQSGHNRSDGEQSRDQPPHQ